MSIFKWLMYCFSQIHLYTGSLLTNLDLEFCELVMLCYSLYMKLYMHINQLDN